MAEDTKKDPGSQLEQEVWRAIAAFEQILEAMPNDIASLETLAHAYEQIGDHTRAKDYLVRLGDVLLGDGDHESAAHLLEKLNLYAKEDPRVAELISRIDKAEKPRSESRPLVAGAGKLPSRDRRSKSGFGIQDELSLAWGLHERHELNREEYAAVVHDLTEMSTSDGMSTISVLHALEFRTAKNFDRIMNALSRRSSTPIISLNSFALPAEAMALIPAEFMVLRGVLCFGFVGPEALVVIMNPENKGLREEVSDLTGRRCHFFMTLPSEFDAAVRRIKTQLDEKPAGPGA
jgi:tetratricopeptide (TPR) repeat protein